MSTYAFARSRLFHLPQHNERYGVLRMVAGVRSERFGTDMDGECIARPSQGDVWSASIHLAQARGFRWFLVVHDVSLWAL